MMMTVLTQRLIATPVWVHLGATLLSFVAFQGTRIYLDKLYAASGHPIDFATGQLAFDGGVTLGYYEAMRAGGTFGIYVQTQLFDFAFIASVMLFGLCFGTLIARMGGQGSLTRKIGVGASIAAITGGTLDALENMMSFVLMQFEAAIPQVLALIYSSFAALKFVALTSAMGLAVVALALGLLGMLAQQVRATQAT